MSGGAFNLNEPTPVFVKNTGSEVEAPIAAVSVRKTKKPISILKSVIGYPYPRAVILIDIQDLLQKVTLFFHLLP